MSTLVAQHIRQVVAAAAAVLLGALGTAAAAQTPAVVSSSLQAVPHNETYGAPWQNAVNRRGDFALLDFKSGGLYIFPATGGPEVSFAPNLLAGGFTDSGIAIDPRNNNMYIDDNYNGGLLELAWDAATQSYDIPAKQVATSLSGDLGGSCGNYFQSAGLSINDSGLLAVGTENGCGVEIFTVQINTDGTFGAATPIVANMTARARTLAIDDAGNVYFTEDAGLPGVRYIPAGVSGLAIDTGVARIDPNLGNVIGVSVDKNGNVYIADSAAGVYLEPLVAGAPSATGAVLLTTAPAQSNVSLDTRHGTLFVPVSSYNGFKDVVDVLLNRVEAGSVAVGSSAATPATVYYTFSGAVTPASFNVLESGTAAPDFAVVTGGTCAAGTAYAAAGTCTVMVSFTPHMAGDLAATLQMLDASGNVLASTALHGVGTSAQVLITPSVETTVGTGLKVPQQIAADAAGNVFVADSAGGRVIEFAAGSSATSAGTAVGTGFVAPTGVAADRAGNVFVADSGKVYMIPVGAAGLNSAAQSMIGSGFGANLQLAVDAKGNVFVSDPANGRIAQLSPLVNGTVELDRTPYAPIDAIAADGSGDLFIASGNTLYELDSVGVRSTLLTTLPTVNGLAVDASGSVYITTASSVIRIPFENGALNTADQVVLTKNVTAPTSVAIDAAGNAYVANATAGNVDFISLNGLLNLGTLTSTSGTNSGTVQITNDGVAALTITGFSSTPDFSVTSTTCTGTAIAAGSSCSATVTFNPGPGDQGALTAALAVQGNQANTGVVINVSGVGASLAASVTSITVGKPTVTSAPVVVTVKPASGTTPVPTGSVTLTVSATGSPAYTFTQTLTNGTTTFNPTEIPVGTYTYKAVYQGDRVYGSSNASSSGTVTAGTIRFIQPATTPIYVLAAGTGAQPPYDGSDLPYRYHYPLQVVTADGQPLVGVPEYSVNPKTGVKTLTGYDYGEVKYVVSGNGPGCGSGTTAKVDNLGAANQDTSCLGIDTSNTGIYNLQTSYTLTPVYDGYDATGTFNPNYTPVTGTSFTIIALRNPVVQISSNPGSLSVAAGSTTSATMTLTSLLGYGVLGAAGNLNNYSLPLQLTCSNLPAHSTCSFAYPTPDPSDPQSTAVTPTATGTVVMTLHTNVAVGTSTSMVRHTEVVFAGMSLAGLCLLMLRRRRFSRLPVLSVALLLMGSAAVASVAGCGSSSNAAKPVLTTPAGTYAVSVTATQAGYKVIPDPAHAGQTITVYGSGNQMSLPFTINVTVQ